MLDENPSNIREVNTLTEDRFKGEKFNLAEDNGWRPIEYGGHVYWISSDYSVVEG